MKPIKSMSKQSGHAALLFAMMIPAFFGIFTLASDGARALQSKARLDDALEVATLAVAAHNDDNKDNGSGQGSAVNVKIATDYISQYMVDMDQVSNLKVVKLSCDQIPECAAGVIKGESRFFEYSVTATTRHTSWFPGNDAIVGFGDNFNVAGAATARKYQSEAVDVVFVADFSGSMWESWRGGRNKKYKDLTDIISKVTDELKKYNDLENSSDNTAAFTGFDKKTYQLKNGSSHKKCSTDQLVYTNNKVNYIRTVERIFSDKHCSGSYDYVDFYDIDVTTDFSRFNQKVKGFSPNGSTASYQGIMRGAQLAMHGSNPRRLIIVLSDGGDSSKNTAQGLVNAGMCTKIVNTLNQQKTPDGASVTGKISVVGFDYNVNSNRALMECAGAENVFKAQNRDDILNKILELITEEIGHLK